MQQPLPEQSANSYERAYGREKKARQQAEMLLEKRSRELYQAKQRIERQLEKLQSAQAQLVQSEKMASVGQLAAGIAHEINNPVAFVRSNLATLQTYLQSFSELAAAYRKLSDLAAHSGLPDFAESLEALAALNKKEDYEFLFEDSNDIIVESQAGTDRVTEIVQGLKNFSRLDENELKDADLNDGIESTIKIAWNEIKYRCEVVKELGDIPTVPCYPGQLNQVFLNLLVNASQAVGDGGVVKITTYAKDDRICVEMTDNGCGIPAENLDSIFNPFFTTKDVGEGTGLGLSISYAIVQKHGGDIQVRSVVGEGTTFVISLPMSGPCEVAT